MTLKRKRKQRLLEHQSTLHAYAMAISGEPEAAADLVQDCAVRVLRSARAPVDNKAFKVWLFAIVRNLWIDNFRKKNVRNEVSIDDLCETALPVQADLVIVNALAVRLAFEELSAHHKDVLALVDVAGFSYAEAAEILDVAHGTVMSRVSRGRCALASTLEQENVVEIFARER